jgi:hypothetical protein
VYGPERVVDYPRAAASTAWHATAAAPPPRRRLRAVDHREHVRIRSVGRPSTNVRLMSEQ